MAEEDEAAEETEASADEPSQKAPTKRRLSGRTLVLFVIAPLLVVALAGGGAYVAGGFDAGETEEVAEVPPNEPKVFYDLPEMLVNLSSHGETRAQYLKVQISVELPSDDAQSALELVLPRVVDLFQVYLRELRITDLDGSAGIYRLKEELERRINLEIHPFSVTDVLFREIIVQ